VGGDEGRETVGGDEGRESVGDDEGREREGDDGREIGRGEWEGMKGEEE